MKKENKFLTFVKEFLIMNLGSILLAVAVYFFKVPNNFASGGVSGLAIILSKFIPLTESQLLVIMNVLLLIIGFIILGKECTFKTVYCSLAFSFGTSILEILCPLTARLQTNPF